MRRIDRLISFLMWGTVAISVLVMGMLVHESSLGAPWPYTIALCLLWVPPALSLGQLDAGPGPPSPWFYRFAVLSLLWSVGIAAYGPFAA
jgi:hypothetical protein